jgi:hypothetical protein
MFVVVTIGRDGVVAMESSFDTDDAAPVVAEANDLWERYLGRDQDARVTVYESVRADDVRRIAGPCAVHDLGAALVGVRGL